MNDDVDFSTLPLRDIHLPEPVSWWPPAPGWWLAALAVIALVAFLWLRHQRSRLRRTALAAVEGVVGRLQDGEEPVQCLQDLSTVLRRFAISLCAHAGGDGRAVAGLTGERWLAFLDSRWDRTAFATPLGRSLIAAPYRPPRSISTEEALALGTLCAEWVRAQQPEREAC